MPQRNRTRVTRRAANIEARMPMVRVTAKPLTVPLARQKRISAVMSEVMLASKMAREGLFVGGLDGGFERLAGVEFLPQAFVDQHVGIDRHADGEDDAGDAGQGEGEAEHRHRAEEDEDVDGSGR